MAFTTYTGTGDVSLTDALLATNSGIDILASSIVLKSSGLGAVSYYDGSLSALGIGSGLLLTSGTTPGTTNTVGWFGQDNSVWPDTYYNGDADIDSVVNTVFQTQSYDATTLEFDFNVTDPTATSISFDLVFGSDEYPEWVNQFVDSAIVMVNGVNYALFNHDPANPLSVVSANLAAGYFQDNLGGVLPIEYDGVSHVLKIVAPVVAGQVNHIKIGIADTGDHIYDSGIFLANFAAGTIPGSGVVITPPDACTDSSDSVTGSAKDEYFDLKGGDDVAYAGAGDDIVVAGAGNDKVYGGSGNDDLKGDAGNDKLDGGDGLADTAVYAGNSIDYAVAYDAPSNSYTVTDLNVGATSEGVDALSNIEYVQFGNGLFQLSADGLVAVSGPGTVPANQPGVVVISGIGAVGNTLTATVSDADGMSSGISYQWQSSMDGLSWTTIGSGSSYTVTAAEVGLSLQVTAAYVDNAAQAESAVSAAKQIYAAQNGDLHVTLMQLDAPAGTSTINPLTTLLKDAIDLGLSPNMAVTALKSVLGIPQQVSLQTYDAYAVLQDNPSDATALAVEMVAVQVAVLTSLSDDDSGMNLTLAILDAAAKGTTLDLANLDNLSAILGIPAILDPLTNQYPQPLAEIYDRNKTMADAIADGGNVQVIANEWSDLLSIQDGIQSTGIADLSIHVNQAPTGSASAALPDASAGAAYTLYASDLLQGYSDPENDTLQIDGLSADQGGTLLQNPDGLSWTFTPDAGYSGPVELSYSVSDGNGGVTLGSQLFVVSAPTNNAPYGEVLIQGALEQNQTLVADLSQLGDADGIAAGTIAYQWLADGVAIANAQGSSYTLTQGEVGKAIAVAVGYTDLNGTPESVTSAASIPVINVDDEASALLLVNAVPTEGGILAASLVNVADADGATSTAYQWQHYANGGWADLDQQTSTSFAIPDDQSYVGESLRVVATTSDSLGGSTEFVGDAFVIANVNDAPTGGLTISGTAMQGQTLALVNSLADGDGLGTMSYQWQADGSNINGATGTSYTLTQAEAGKVVTVTASYTDAYGTAESVTSAATAAVGETLTGTRKADVLTGHGGNDNLSGLAGNDTLQGLGGNDLLLGGAGNDTLTGGLGQDVFRFDSALSASSNVDKVLDFLALDDTLQLENSVFKKLGTTGTLSDLSFRASVDGKAADANDYILYNTQTGALYYDADGSGKGGAVQFATLLGVPTITADDFLVT